MASSELHFFSCTEHIEQLVRHWLSSIQLLLHMDLSRSKWTLDMSLMSIVQPTNWIYIVLPVGSVVFAILATVRDGHLIADSWLLRIIFWLFLLLICSLPYWSVPAETRSSSLNICHLKISQISDPHVTYVSSYTRWIQAHEYSRNKTKHM